VNGIPLTIRRDGELEKVYLSTHRSGEKGEKFRTLKREFHRAHIEAAKAGKSSILTMEKAEKIEDIETLEKLAAEQDGAMDRLDEARARTMELAEAIVRESLGGNYPDGEVDGIMDCMTDAQLVKCVSIIETGDVPADFFPSPDTPPSESTTSPPGGSISGSSSSTDTPGPSSTPGK